MDAVAPGDLTADPQGQRLVAAWTEIRALAGVEMLLSWDQETMMPSGAAESRAIQLATVAGLRHAKLVDDDLLEMILACERDDPGDPNLVALGREARRAVERARKVSTELARSLAAARSRGVASWQRARKANRFALFRDDLARLLDLKRQEAAALNEAAPYDGLLDEFEPGATAKSLEALFAPLEAALSELVRDVGRANRRPELEVPRGRFPIDRQLSLGRMIGERIGFDFARGRLDGSAHPFCTGIARTDVRLTWRAAAEDFRPGLFGILHELGHGLYEQGLPADWRGSPLAEPASLGIHESQSRLWENHVGRSVEFWHWLLPHFRSAFPDFGIERAEALWPALHAVSPSAVRVDADETTYDLHIVARFRLERALFDGSLNVDELPAAWVEETRRLLNVDVPDDNLGVLQDIHWATGLFGYFPTYTLGNLTAAQLFEAAIDQVPDLRPSIARGHFEPLTSWLLEKIHRRGALLTPAALVAEATGAPLSATCFLRRITHVCHTLYG
jgi:carboxypeptidase Taq